ncbi:MAG: hypothetical protein H7321_09570 [Bacteroidia bacterium]|nr:hypothetical protein [Bacteroidia bacterium]
MTRKLFILLFLLPFSGFCQHDTTGFSVLREYENELKIYADTLRGFPDESRRLEASKAFRETLSAALELPNSFNYPFDSINKLISFIRTDDNRLRVITWVVIDDRHNFYNNGVVQYKVKKTIQTEWLTDNMPKDDSLFSENDASTWIGCLYYQVQTIKRKGNVYYNILGYDGMNGTLNRKIVDVIWINKENELSFGAPLFKMSALDYTPQYRLIFHFSEVATMLLRFEPKRNYLVYSHLGKALSKLSDIPEYSVADGSFDYFLLKKGRWENHGQLKDFSFQE